MLLIVLNILSLEPLHEWGLSLRLRRLYRSLELVVGVRNLFDERWLDPAPSLGLPEDYPRAGFSLFVNARYAF